MVFRLHSRLVLWNLLVLGSIVAVLSFFVSGSLRRHIEGQIEDQLSREAALAAEYIATRPPASPSETANRLGAMLGVRVTLIAPDGQVVGDSEVLPGSLPALEKHLDRPEVQEALQKGTGASIRYSTTLNVNFIYVARRATPFIVRLAKPFSATDELIGVLRSRLAVAMLLATFGTLAFGYLVYGLISRPLRTMAAVSQELAGGNLDRRLPISGDEEIVALGSALNTMAQNLSDRMRDLSDGKQRLELIVGAMSEGVMVLDRDGRVSLANQAVHNLIENDYDLSGKTPLDLFRNPSLDSVVRRALAGDPVPVVEMTTGNGRTVQAHVAPVADAAGMVDSVVVVFHDLTEIRSVERMRRDFVANVSHEFKTPLTSIRGYAETLSAGALQDPVLSAEFVKTIERNARLLEALVADLLTLARLEAEVPAALEAVSVKTIVDEQLALRQTACRDLGLLVFNDCPDVEIAADPTRLTTAVSNLIDNAVHYNRPGGEICITGDSRKGTLSLSISDTGAGIPAEDVSRVFERFYRVDKARSRKSGGTGLGLAIVKHAIESQGGTIGVSSRFGAGSTFTITLPAS